LFINDCFRNILIGSINVLSCLYFAVASAFAIWWTIARKQAYAWVLQDLFGVAVLLMMQRSIRLPNIKISMTLLLCAFVYDIYWVFLSPLFFSESVMIKVATGGNTGEAIPMLLKVPRVNDVLGGYSLLGLGDVALPGLFVSFVLRFDYMKRTTSLLNSYFFISTVAYGVGLIMTYVGLALMKSGQVRCFARF
jgi:signal peptide peptidase-like protein 2B